MIFHARFTNNYKSVNIDLWNEPTNFNAKKKLYLYQLDFPHITGPNGGPFLYYLNGYESCDIDIKGLRVRSTGANPHVKVSVYAKD